MITAGIFSTLVRYARAARIRRIEMRAIRQLNSLPPEIRDDIGWPNLHFDENGRLTLDETPIAAQQADGANPPLPQFRKSWTAPPIPPQCPAKCPL